MDVAHDMRRIPGAGLSVSVCLHRHPVGPVGSVTAMPVPAGRNACTSRCGPATRVCTFVALTGCPVIHAAAAFDCRGSRGAAVAAAFQVKSCCENSCAVEALHERQRSVLVVVLCINAVMFAVIVSAAFYGRSTALFSDSLDNLGDALTYGLSLFAISRSTSTKARVALLKGVLILLAASLVVVNIIQRLVNPVLPSFEVMGIFSVAGLLANGVCLFLLWRHRQDDINMSSVYECSRNDIASNLSVILAASGVWVFASAWPDLLIGALLAALLLMSSARVIGGALGELAKHRHRAEGG